MIRLKNFTFVDDPKELSAERYFHFRKYYSASLQGCSLSGFVGKCNQHSQKLALFIKEGATPAQLNKLLIDFENIKFGAYTELAEENLLAYKAFCFLVYSINDRVYEYKDTEKPAMMLYPIELVQVLEVASESINESLKASFPKMFHSETESKYIDFCQRQINTLDIRNLDENSLNLDRAKYGFNLASIEFLNTDIEESILNSKPEDSIKALANALDKPYSEVATYSIFDFYVSYENIQNKQLSSSRRNTNSPE